MNDNTIANFVYVIRSINFYGAKKPPVQYSEETFGTWVNGHKNQEAEIKKTHALFSFETLPQLTLEYFK